MITRLELNKHSHPESPEIAANLDHLLEVMNVVRAAYGKPMVVTSGLRSLQDQTRIDSKRIVGGKPAGPRLGSQHLQGNAVDIWDRDGELWKFCMDHMDLIVTLGIYLEDKNSTPSWVHFQTRPPRSGNRIFVP